MAEEPKIGEINAVRDPERIPTVLEEIERIWRLHPDWRLGQLISNLAAWADESVWDIEEDRLIEEIRRHVQQLDQPIQAK